MRIWLDTDIGSDVDDALTLAYVLRHPGFELVGVSTVFGDVALRTLIAERLLEIAGSPEVPVLTGLGVPLSPGRKGVMFGHEGLGLFEDPKPQMRVENESDAESRMEHLREELERAAPDVLVAIGPLSNLGALATAGVSLPPLAIMGGKLQDVMLPGMSADISEWNWWCDPLAVQRVIAAPHSSLPRVVPAEVTFRTQLAQGDIERLAGGDALARTLSTLCDHWLTALRDRFGARHPRVALHDPLTAATLVAPELCPFERRRIRVDDSGATEPDAGDPNVEAATDVDNDALCAELMRIWLSD